ncbi:MAG TPA: ABC transporter permease [Candidatus Galloscillospira stercoripullorum]|nr:ABC transporter permease [Candidatus Galloscillospira stercoripullorum]
MNNPLRPQDVPASANKRHVDRLLEQGKTNAGGGKKHEEEQFSLNDDRRVKSLSPGALVAKRFFRNRLAVVGLVMLIAMFLFSFVGGWISPYGQDEIFYIYEGQQKQYVGVVRNDTFRYAAADGQEFGSAAQAQVVLAMNQGKDTFTYRDVEYTLAEEGSDFYTIYAGNTLVAMAYKDIVNAPDGVSDSSLTFNFQYGALKAYANGESEFSADGVTYRLDDQDIYNGSELAGYISRFVVRPVENGVVITRHFKEELELAIETDDPEFLYTDTDGVEYTYTIQYDPATQSWSVKQEKLTYVADDYALPSAEHPLGTDKNGMDMLTRLMYGGRVSLVIGFIVVIISGFIGVILGGISGYFGKWVDNFIMRVVDVFYCIPSMPLIIILGAAMDAMQVDPMMRIFYLMLVLGFLGWPSIARMVRGQILSLREQEFMTATEACGISVSRRIFRHLIPNVIPQLIVICTMSLGSTIITEATLSFLGLGVKFPFASWGNIINDVNNAYVMTNYLWIWIPAGVCLLITVLGFNFVGDGLRDAFDPRMKR